MSNKIFIFVPINIGRNLESLLRRKAPDIEFITPSSSAQELKYFSDIFTEPDENDLPELIVTLQPEILKYFQNPEVRKFYVDISTQFPGLRDDLKSMHLESTDLYTKPLLYAPVIMMVNKELAERPEKWSDLADERFKGRILCPDSQTPVSIAFNNLFRDMEKREKTESILNEIKYSGLPFDVITGVNKGFYDIGLLPLPFARYSMGKNVETVIPEEGPIVLPQMMFLKKNASEETISVAKELFGKNIQRFFSQLGALIPVIEEVPLPVEIKSEMKFYWKNWEWYKNLAINKKEE